MIKKRKNLILVIFIILIEILILFNPKTLVSSSKDAINLFVNKLFISLFPFFVLNKILINYNLPYYISKLKLNIISKLLNINNSYISIIILSLLTGMPSNAEYIKDYLDKGIISLSEAKKLLIITFFPSPVFVITVIGYLGFNSIFIGVILLLLIYLFNFLLGLIIRNKYNNSFINNNKLKIINNKKFMLILKESIFSSLSSLMIILGNIIIFSIILGLLNNYLNLSPVSNSIISSLLELTNGIKKISDLSTNFNIKFSFCVFALTFSSLSIHFQVSSILSDYNINFSKILLYRLLSSIIFSLTLYMISLLF